jgi:hypothetical protein
MQNQGRRQGPLIGNRIAALRACQAKFRAAIQQNEPGGGARLGYTRADGDGANETTAAEHRRALPLLPNARASG